MKDSIGDQVMTTEKAFQELSAHYQSVRRPDGSVDLNALYVFAKTAWTFLKESWELFYAVIREVWCWATGKKSDPAFSDADIAALLSTP